AGQTGGPEAANAQGRGPGRRETLAAYLDTGRGRAADAGIARPPARGPLRPAAASGQATAAFRPPLLLVGVHPDRRSELKAEPLSFHRLGWRPLRTRFLSRGDTSSNDWFALLCTFRARRTATRPQRAMQCN